MQRKQNKKIRPPLLSLFEHYEDKKEYLTHQQDDGEDYFEKALSIRATCPEKFSDQELKYLKIAQNLKNFHAEREIQYYYLEQLKEQVNDKIIELIRDQAEVAASTYGTPGNLLAATSYIQLAKHIESTDPLMQESAYFNALRHLYLARELECISGDQIQHAYFGENIQTAFKKGYASILDIPFESFEQIIELFLRLTKLNLTFAKKIEVDAIKIANEIKTTMNEYKEPPQLHSP